MTISFKLSSFLCLLAAFIWQTGTESHWVASSNEEEEEKRLNIVFGNLSFKSTIPPHVERATTKSAVTVVTFPEGEHTISNILQHNKTKANLTEFDDLRVRENKNDPSPENSVDDGDSAELVNSLYKGNSKSVTLPVVDSQKETTTEMDDVSTEGEMTFAVTVTPESETASSFEENIKFKIIPEIRTEKAESQEFGEKTTSPVPITTSSSVSSPLWNIVKSMKPVHLSPVTDPSFKTFVETLTTNTETSTTLQTSENIIPVEGSGSNKLDSSAETHLNKSEKSKFNKQSDVTSSPDEALRTSPKMPTVPTTIGTKVTIPNESGETTTLLSKLIESANNTTSLPTGSYYERYSTTTKPWSSEAFDYRPPKKDFEGKIMDAISSSSVPPNFNLPSEYNSPFLSLFTTPSWHNPKSSISSKQDSVIKDDIDISPRLSPSFRESSSSTEKTTEETTMSSLKEIVPDVSSSSTGSPTISYDSTTRPKEISHVFTKATTNAIPTLKEELIPPPRLTNPGCTSLPVCIEITLGGTTWEEFCSQGKEFQEFLSKVVSQYLHSIHHHQIILEADQCIRSPTVYAVQSSSDITVALYMTDDSGEYSEKLTEICALILRKWAPTVFRNSIMEVKLYNSEFQSTAIPIIPELNSGFVAAVSISAVAGVALCMLCILLIVMKQKLLHGRGSENTSPAADSYSLDSLSINASFRRRRNRRSARSYLNHAFSDHEIPSHPLNEKSLQNCLKNRDILEEEFRKIPMNMPKLDQIPEGAHVKNRYSNILPKPESRVVLAEPSGDPLKCYINANYIKGYGGKASTYIACQAPLPEGIEDFWRMIWEQQCRVIVMLTMFEENGTSRCAVYFPQSTLITNTPYGDFQVSLLKKDVYEFYTMSTLRLLDMEKNLFRDIVHLWFTGWPDVGVPKDPSTLITFVQQCRPFINCNAGPTVVHCSTGTGRTGVFIALDICMREYDESRSIDILQCVSQLRRDRGGAVQNKDQYILIHEAMLEYICQTGNHSQHSSLQS